MERSRQFEVGEAEQAAVVRTRPGQHSPLGGDEGNGQVGAHGGAPDPAGVGIESGRKVQYQHRQRARVDPVDHRAILGARLAAEAGAQQRVDEQIMLRVDQSFRCERQRFDAGSHRVAAGHQRFAPQLFRCHQRHQGDAETRTLRQFGQHIPIATVVAAAAEYQKPPRLRPVAAQYIEGGTAGAPHQHRPIDAGKLLCQPIELA